MCFADDYGLFGVVFFWVFQVLMYFMLVNVFIAIVSDAYAKVVAVNPDVTNAGAFWDRIVVQVKELVNVRDHTSKARGAASDLRRSYHAHTSTHLVCFQAH